PSLVAAASAVPCALHSDRHLVDQPGGALVRDADRQTTAPRRSSQYSRLGDDDPALYRHHQRTPRAVRLEQDRGRDPRQRRPILPTNLQLRTLVASRPRLPRYRIIAAANLVRRSTEAAEHH